MRRILQTHIGISPIQLNRFGNLQTPKQINDTTNQLQVLASSLNTEPHFDIMSVIKLFAKTGIEISWSKLMSKNCSEVDTSDMKRDNNNSCAHARMLCNKNFIQIGKNIRECGLTWTTWSDSIAPRRPDRTEWSHGRRNAGNGEAIPDPRSSEETFLRDCP